MSDAAATLPGDDATATRPRRGEAGLQAGVRLGRYELLGRLGAGSMGVVFSARDPELDREVALKILKRTGARQRERMLREARALAALSHPNIVTILDVGEKDDLVYLAMERIEGVTLEQWLAQAQRRPRDVFAVFLQVGRGLAAAHAAGFVHRDVKPSNIMIGPPLAGQRSSIGRVRVTDFGIVAVMNESIDPEHRSRSNDEAAAGSGVLTRADDVIGTPAYMAPEQAQHGSIDARADVFSFCVCLYEALCGRRPYAGMTVPELLQRWNEPPEPLTVRRGVGRGMRAVVEQGIATDPAARPAALDPILRALERELSPGMGWRVGLVATALAVGTAVVALDSAAPACREDDAWSETWSDARRQRLHDAVVSTGLSYASGTADALATTIDEHVQTWRDARSTACATMRDERLASTLTCLQSWHEGLDAKIGVVENVDAKSVDKALGIMRSTRRADDCLRDDLAGFDGVSPLLARMLALIQADIERANALADVGRVEEALVAARSALALAEASGRPTTRRRAAIEVARGLAGMQRSQEAHDLLEELHFEARADADHDNAFFTAMDLASLEVTNDPSERAKWLRQARLMFDAGPRRDWEVAVFAEEARHAYYAGDVAAAIEHTRRALAATQDPFYRARLLLNTGLMLQDSDRYAEAHEAFEQASQTIASGLGVDHPMTIIAEAALAICLDDQGEFERAATHMERASTIASRVPAPPELPLSSILVGTGETIAKTGRNDLALAYIEAGIAVAVATGARATVESGWLAHSAILRHLGRPAEALAECDKVQPPSEDDELSVTTASVLACETRALLDLDRVEEACERAERGHASCSRIPEPLADDCVATMNAILGGCLVASGRSENAIAPLEAALGERGWHPLESAALRFALARALRETGGATERIDELVAQSRREALAVGGHDLAQRIAAWSRRR